MTDVPLGPHEFDLLRALVRRQIGVSLNDSKRVLVESRLRSRLRQLGLKRYMDYYDHLRADGAGGELQEFVDAITTNTTSFFRERAHFDYVTEELVPEWAKRSGRLRLWSAACSSGQEPYSLAATVLAAWPDANKADLRILATDVSQRALEKAQAGVYPVGVRTEVPERYRAYFPVRGAGPSRSLGIDERLKAMILFRPLNLISSRFPFRGRFDLILCRNVLIYFSPEDRRVLVERLVSLVAPGGHLFLGLSEALVQAPSGLESVGGSIYRRLGSR